MIRWHNGQFGGMVVRSGAFMAPVWGCKTAASISFFAAVDRVRSLARRHCRHSDPSMVQSSNHWLRLPIPHHSRGTPGSSGSSVFLCPW
jgi:hypothetical protein